MHKTPPVMSTCRVTVAMFSSSFNTSTTGCVAVAVAVAGPRAAGADADNGAGGGPAAAAAAARGGFPSAWGLVRGPAPPAWPRELSNVAHSGPTWQTAGDGAAWVSMRERGSGRETC
jgi:hypothetical protein